QHLTYHTAWLPLTYVLCAGTRGDWEREALAGTLHTIREQVAALVTIREQGSLAGVQRLTDTGLHNLAGQLPRPWIAELGLALHALGRPSGRHVLEALGKDIHTLVRALTQHAVPSIAQAARAIRPTLPAMPRGPLEIRVLGTMQVITSGK